MPMVEFQGDRSKLSSWLKREYSDAVASRRTYERQLDEWDRQYEQIPRISHKTFPWDGASNLETPVGATHVDTVVSRLESAYFATLPWVIVRSLAPRYVEHAQALQDFMNQVTLPNSGYRQEKAVDLLSTVKLGTSFQWLSYEIKSKRIRNSDGSPRDIVMHDGPVQRFVHPRHLIFPQEARDIQNARWITIRNYETWGQVQYNGHRGYYDSEAVANLGGRGSTNIEDVRRLARQGIGVAGAPLAWQNNKTYCLYQEEPDSPPEDIWVDWNWPTGEILKAIYNPYDHVQWPLSRSQYMIRESAFSGIGIMSMLSMIQEEISTIHNYCLDNLLAANTVVVLTKKNTIKSLDIYPMAQIDYTGDKDAIRFERLGTALSGQQVGEAAANGYAERRTGVSEGNVNRMAPQRGLSGSRTPATTTLALLGESNKRFELAIENSKAADSILLMQHALLLRQYWPRQRKYAYAWHAQKARLIEDLFMQDIDIFRHAVVLEVAASTSAVNRDIEKQNILVLGEYMREFYGIFLSFVKLQAEAPQLKPLVDKIINGISTFAERLLRTFDIRDPERFILKLDDIGTNVAAEPARAAEDFTSAFLTGAPVGASNGNVGSPEGGGAVRA